MQWHQAKVLAEECRLFGDPPQGGFLYSGGWKPLDREREEKRPVRDTGRFEEDPGGPYRALGSTLGRWMVAERAALGKGCGAVRGRLARRGGPGGLNAVGREGFFGT